MYYLFDRLNENSVVGAVKKLSTSNLALHAQKLVDKAKKEVKDLKANPKNVIKKRGAQTVAAGAGTFHPNPMYPIKAAKKAGKIFDKTHDGGMGEKIYRQTKKAAKETGKEVVKLVKDDPKAAARVARQAAQDAKPHIQRAAKQASKDAVNYVKENPKEVAARAATQAALPKDTGVLSRLTADAAVKGTSNYIKTSNNLKRKVKRDILSGINKSRRLFKQAKIDEFKHKSMEQAKQHIERIKQEKEKLIQKTKEAAEKKAEQEKERLQRAA